MNKKMVIALMAVAVATTAFAQVTVNLTSYNPPILVSGSGGSFDYNIEATNNDTSSQTFDVWCMVTLPNGSSYGPVLGPVNVTLAGGNSVNRDRTQNVPTGAPEGSYTFHAYAGDYPDVVWSSDSFLFEKLPPPPDTLWTQTFGGSSAEEGHSVQQTDDGGYIFGGVTYSYGAGMADVYLIKTDENGDTSWTRTFGGSHDDRGECSQQTFEGGYIITGQTESFGAGIGTGDVYLIKTDSSGSEEWYQTFGGGGYDYGRSVIQTLNDGYIIAGHTTSYGAGSVDVYLIKTDGQGNEIWTMTFGGSDYDYGYSVQQTTDGGYIVTGSTRSFGAGGDDVYLIKTDASGEELWNQTFGASGSEIGYCVQQTSDGGFIIVGITDSFGAFNVYLIKTDDMGNEEWHQIFGGDIGRSVQLTDDNGFIIAGQTRSYGVGAADVYLLKTDASGNELWFQTVGGYTDDYGFSVDQTSDGGFVVGGYTYSFGNSSEFYLIRISSENEANHLFGVPPVAEIMVTPSDYSLLQNYPNPFNPTTTISFELPTANFVHLAVYDVSGRLVTELINGWRDAGKHEVTFDGSGLVSGVYVYRIEAGDFYTVQKMVLVK